jgi:hypothetical protein
MDELTLSLIDRSSKLSAFSCACISKFGIDDGTDVEVEVSTYDAQCPATA